MHKISNSKIFITGGAGFIGSYVVEELLRYHPARVVILDSLIRGSLANMAAFINHPAVEFIEGDIRDTALLEKGIRDADYVFHMAALRINACAARPRDGFEVMLRSTFELAELCVKHRVKKVIYSSSASVYGLARNFPTPETDHPYDNQTFYGGAKLWGEQLFRSYKFMHGLDYVALRYFNVYGPRMDTDGKYTEVMIRWLDCIREGREPVIHGDGSTTMDFVYVKDVARANVAALLSPVGDQAFNIGNCREVSLKELLRILLQVNGCELQPRHTGENTINPVSRRLADITRAATLLDFTPRTGLEQGLAELSRWYDHRKNLVGAE
ncbi:MAG TPA: NAD-dependent epimerase/dehydratase family protein [Sphingobacteriaceae bacterium]